MCKGVRWRRLCIVRIAVGKRGRGAVGACINRDKSLSRVCLCSVRRLSVTFTNTTETSPFLPPHVSSIYVYLLIVSQTFSPPSLELLKLPVFIYVNCLLSLPALRLMNNNPNPEPSMSLKSSHEFALPGLLRGALIYTFEAIWEYNLYSNNTN